MRQADMRLVAAAAAFAAAVHWFRRLQVKKQIHREGDGRLTIKTYRSGSRLRHLPPRCQAFLLLPLLVASAAQWS